MTMTQLSPKGSTMKELAYILAELYVNEGQVIAQVALIGYQNEVNYDPFLLDSVSAAFQASIHPLMNTWEYDFRVNWTNDRNNSYSSKVIFKVRR